MNELYDLVFIFRFTFMGLDDFYFDFTGRDPLFTSTLALARPKFGTFL